MPKFCQLYLQEEARFKELREKTRAKKGNRFQVKYADGLGLFEDVNERRITFAEFLNRFRELPREEQDRLLATDPKPMAKKDSMHR